MTDADTFVETNDSIAVATDEDKKIDDAVVFINETANKTIYKGSIEIGDYILKHFFDDDIKLAASKNPKKSASFVKLCERVDLAIHPSRLGLMVRVASQEKFLLAEEDVDPEQISYTHKASLVKLENNPNKVSLVKQCIEDNWTTRELVEKIKEAVNLESSPPKISFARTASKFIKKIDDVLNIDDAAFKIDDNEISKLSGTKRKKLVGQIQDLKTKIAANAERSKTVTEDCDKLLARLKPVAKDKKTETPMPAEESTSTAPLK
jgi:hypothetical protein